jgi:RNA polymerase sigma-70 factor (ECF subfamily)
MSGENRTLEEQALELARQGNVAEAIALLMKGYGPLIATYCARTLRDRDVAQDVCQKVFCEAFQGFQQFKAQGSLLSWLFGIARHRCLDEARRRQRTPLTEDLADADHHPELATSEATRDPAMEHNLRHCLSELPPEIRSAVVLRFLEGFTHVEIGEETGTPPGTIQVQISRALIKLRKCLQRRGVRGAKS